MKNSTQPGTEKEILRIALNKQAAQDYVRMVSRLKAENPDVWVQPSAFVSFLVSDFYATYFEKDLEILVAEFFDSKSYYEAQLQRVKSQGDFEKIMSMTLTEIKRVKAKTRRKSHQRRKSKTTSPTNSVE